MQLVEQRETSGKPQLTLPKEAIIAFKENPYEPEVVGKYWETYWGVRGGLVGLSKPTIYPCNRTSEGLEHLDKIEKRKMVFLPDKFIARENLVAMFPEIQGISEEGVNFIMGQLSQGFFGWLNVEKSLDSPRLNMGDRGLRKQFEKEIEVPQRGIVYVVSSIDAGIQTDHYYDEATKSRLLGFRNDGAWAYASPEANGSWRIKFNPGRPKKEDLRGSSIGGRSETV